MHDAELITLASHVATGSRSGPRLLITGGVHGDECEPMAAVRRLIADWPVEETRGSVTLIPVVNEAASKRGRRTAEDDLDLARTCPGSLDGSVTERTAAALTEQIQQADYYVDLHTGGAIYDIWPLAGYMLHPDQTIRRKQRAMAEAFNLPVVWGTSARLDGRSLSVARDAGVPAIYAEHGGGSGCLQTAVDDYVAGCLNVAASLDMLDRPLPHRRVLYCVEDDRPDSGHLQVQQPSPADGFFEPRVALGDLVEEGELLGQVVSPLGDVEHDVCAESTGRVLLLRSFPRVARQDTLAVILPIREPGEMRLTGD